MLIPKMLFNWWFSCPFKNLFGHHWWVLWRHKWPFAYKMLSLVYIISLFTTKRTMLLLVENSSPMIFCPRNCLPHILCRTFWIVRSYMPFNFVLVFFVLASMMSFVFTNERITNKCLSLVYIVSFIILSMCCFLSY